MGDLVMEEECKEEFGEFRWLREDRNEYFLIGIDEIVMYSLIISWTFIKNQGFEGI